MKPDDFGEITLPDNHHQNHQSSKHQEQQKHSVTSDACVGTGNQSPSIAELYLARRCIPFDQLKEALSSTVLCPSATPEMIDSVLELVCLPSKQQLQCNGNVSGGAGEENEAALRMAMKTATTTKEKQTHNRSVADSFKLPLVVG